MNKSFVVLLLLTVPCLASAELYKWVDKNGQVHYSERPPSAGTYEPVKPAPPAANPSPTVESPDESVEENDDRRAEELEKRKLAAAAAEKENRDTRCRMAKAHLAGLKQTSRTFTTDEAGNRYYYSEQERADQFAQVEQVIDKECD